jgi:hypothetical protein
MLLFRAMLAAAAFMVAAIGFGAAQAQSGQRTVASAHDFLRTVMARGTTYFEVVDSRNEGWSRGFETIERVEGSQCETALYATQTDQSGTHAVSRRIDWSRVSSVGGNSAIWIAGSVRATNGEVLDGVQIRTESYELGVRIVAAMDFLRQSCDSTGGIW